jgi:uncharacterized protein (TIGR03000 family)
MYSLVLMAMIGTSDTVPAGNGCLGGGCHGCRGGGYSCGGGCNGGCNGCFGGFFRRRHGCNGGCNGCSGGYGGCSGGYGCAGGRVYGCNGGGVMYGCNGGGVGYGCNGGVVVPQNAPPPEGELKKKPEAFHAPAAPAYITVNLPEDAKLFINDQPTRSTSTERRFASPPLNRDQQHTYPLRAEIMRDGQPVTVTREVAVRGGEETRVRLDFPPASVAQR